MSDRWLLTIPFSFPTFLVWSSLFYFLSGYCPICHLLNQLEWQIFTVYKRIIPYHFHHAYNLFWKLLLPSPFLSLSYIINPPSQMSLPHIHVFSVYFVTQLLYPRFYVARVSYNLLESGCLSGYKTEGLVNSPLPESISCH